VTVLGVNRSEDKQFLSLSAAQQGYQVDVGPVSRDLHSETNIIQVQNVVSHGTSLQLAPTFCLTDVLKLLHNTWITGNIGMTE
jgi:hypothetical protein